MLASKQYNIICILISLISDWTYDPPLCATRNYIMCLEIDWHMKFSVSTIYHHPSF